MAVGIELESRLPGVRGAQTQGGAWLPSVQDGIGAALGEALKGLPQAAQNADFHTRLEAINKMDLDNQAAEAELAFDRWNAQAMWGKDKDAPTTLETFEGEKDATKRAIGLRGLMRLKGNAAGAAAGMYGKASETAINDILNGMAPQVRGAVRNRLLGKRNATLTRMEHHGFTEREAAVRAQNAAVMDARAQQNAEEAADAARRIDVAGYAARLRTAEEAYNASLANIVPKMDWERMNPGAGKYEDYKRQSEETAKKNLDGAVAAITAERDAAFAAVGASYAVKQNALTAQKRASILTELGATEKDVANNPQLAFAVEGQLAAYKQKAGAAFIQSMIDTEGFDFAKAALADEAKLISDYGITDSRVRAALRQRLEVAETKKMREQNQNDEMVAFEVSQAGLLAPDGVNWKYGTDYFVALRDESVAAGNYAAAARYNAVIAGRQEAEAGAVKLAKERAAMEAAGEYTPEQWNAALPFIVAKAPPYVKYRLGSGEVVTVSKAALVKDIVWNELGLKSETAKKALYDSYNLADGGDAGTRSLTRVLSGKNGPLGFVWQATEKPVNGKWSKGEADGDVYTVLGSDEDPRNASLFTQDSKGDFIVNDAVAMGRLGVPLMVDGEESQQWLSPEEMGTVLSTMNGLARAYAKAHPEASEQELDKYVYNAFVELTVGTDVCPIYTEGKTLQERQTELLSFVEALTTKAAAQETAYLRAMTDKQRTSPFAENTKKTDK